MSSRANQTMVLALLFAGLLVACGPSYRMETPASFSRFEESSAVKMITAEGVRLRVREVENYPKAPLEFWTEAMRTHMKKQGYLVHAEACFKTVNKLGADGCTLDLVIPYGREDWWLSETIYVVDEVIYLVEAAGPFELFQAVDVELKEALRSFAVQ